MGNIPVPGTSPAIIAVCGARHNSLWDVDVGVPLCGRSRWPVSGLDKTSLAIGVLA